MGSVIFVITIEAGGPVVARSDVQCVQANGHICDRPDEVKVTGVRYPPGEVTSFVP